jgi:hypothetical protein
MSYKYRLYEYIEGIQYRYNEYKKELSNNNFDIGKIRAFNDAITIIEELLKENDYLMVSKVNHTDSSFIVKHKNIMQFNVNTEINFKNEDLVKITKIYIVKVQKLYNDLADGNSFMEESIVQDSQFWKILKSIKGARK